MKQKISLFKIILCLLFICNIIIRFYKLDTLIPSVYSDEAAISYSSWCLLNYGTDRYMNSFPIYVKNFYGGQSAAYAYLLIPIIKIFGLNIFSVRFLNAFAYATAFIVLYLILNAILKNQSSILFSLSLYTFSPLITHFSRFGLDCDLILPLTIISFYFTLKAIDTEKTRFYAAAAAAWALTLYTYAIAYIIVPAFLIVLFLLLIKNKKITLKQSLIVVAILLGLSWPLLLQLFTVCFIKHPWHLGPITFITFATNRVSEINTSNVFKNIKDLCQMIITYKFHYFYPIIFSSFYLVSAPFILIGIAKSAKGILKLDLKSIPILFFITTFISLIFVEDLYPHRILTIALPVICLIGIGIENFLKTHEMRKRAVLSIVYLISIMLFIFYYFTPGLFSKYYDRNTYTQNPYTDVLTYIENNDDLKQCDIYILGKDPDGVTLPFYLGGVDPKKLMDFDDTKYLTYDDLKFDKYHMMNVSGYESGNVYVIDNNRIYYGYDEAVVENIKEVAPNKKEFEFYSIYY